MIQTRRDYFFRMAIVLAVAALTLGLVSGLASAQSTLERVRESACCGSGLRARIRRSTLSTRVTEWPGSTWTFPTKSPDASV